MGCCTARWSACLCNCQEFAGSKPAGAVACIIKIRRRTYDASVVLFTIMKVLQRRKYDAGVVTQYFWLKKYDASVVNCYARICSVIYDANVVNYDRIGFYNTGHRCTIAVSESTLRVLRRA